MFASRSSETFFAASRAALPGRVKTLGTRMLGRTDDMVGDARPHSQRRIWCSWSQMAVVGFGVAAT